MPFPLNLCINTCRPYPEPPELPVPAVQGGAVETLVTHLIRENERAGKLDLLCASIPDPEAAAQAQGLQHTKMLYVAKPRGEHRYCTMVFLERCRPV